MKKVILSLAVLGALSLQAKVYATVGSKDITDVDIDQVLRVMPNGALIQKYGGIDNLDSAKKKQIIDIAVGNYLLSKKAEDEGITKTKEFKEKLENIKLSLSTQIYTDRIIKSIKVSDSEIKEYYDKHSDKFKEPQDKVRARHILLPTKEEALKVAEELKKAKDVEKKFIELAKEKSIGPSGKDGGELGWFDKNTMVKEFSDVAFSLKKGQLSKEPVKTQFGFHLIYVEDKLKKGTVIAFEKVKDQIKDIVKTQKIRTKIDDILKLMREKTKVQYK